MATNYPSAVDSLTNPAGTNNQDSPDHASQHANANDAIEAIETTVGTTAGTNVLRGFAGGDFPLRINAATGPGTLQQAITGTVNATAGTFNNLIFGTPDITGGTMDNAVFGTPATTGGTANNQVLGTPTLTLSSDATGDIFFRSAGGTVNRLAVGAANQFLGVASGLPSWGTAILPADRSIFGSTVSNTTTETTVYSYAVPANTIGTNRMLRTKLFATHLNNSGTTHTLTINYKYGAGTVSTTARAFGADAGTYTTDFDFYLLGNGATNSQVGGFAMKGRSTAGLTSDAANGTSGIDSTSAQNLVITVTHQGANASTTFTKLWAITELL